MDCAWIGVGALKPIDVQASQRAGRTPSSENVVGVASGVSARSPSAEAGARSGTGDADGDAESMGSAEVDASADGAMLAWCRIW